MLELPALINNPCIPQRECDSNSQFGHRYSYCRLDKPRGLRGGSLPRRGGSAAVNAAVLKLKGEENRASIASYHRRVIAQSLRHEAPEADT